MVEISVEMMEAIATHAATVFPEECCGILLGVVAQGSVRIRRVIAAANVADAMERRKRYVVEPLAILRADRAAREQGWEIVGGYHSHPDHPAVPSGVDAGMAWEGYVYLIVSIGREGVREAKAWRFYEGVESEEMIRVTGL